MEEDLEQGLLQTHEFHKSGKFGVSSQALQEFFNGNNIRDHISIQKLKDIGGTKVLLQKLNVDASKGLDLKDFSDIRARKEQFGTNKHLEQPPKSFWELITEQLEDRTLQILIAATIVSLILGIIREGFPHGILDGIGIFVAVSIILLVTATNNYLKEQQFKALYAKSQDKDVKVLRSGQLAYVNSEQLLVGDIVFSEIGDINNFDALVLQSSDLEIDESSMNGETDLIKKVPAVHYTNEENPFLVSGTSVVNGSATLLILAVGQNTYEGKIKQMLQQEDEETPLQLKLNVLADKIGVFGFNCALLTFSCMTIHLVVERLYFGEELFNMELINLLLEYFMIGVTVVVVAVPEGLPLAVTIAFAYSVGKMYDEKNLVRYLSACETMGGANNICSDKTGTLTTNIMTVVKLFIADEVFDNFKNASLNNKLEDILTESVCVNSSAQPLIDTYGKFEYKGSRTDCALLEMAYKLGKDYRKYRPSENIIRVNPFNSKQKQMSTVYRIDQNRYRFYIKGAPEYLLDKCASYVNDKGEIAELNEDYKVKIREKIIKKFAAQKYRNILIAYKEFTGEPANQSDEVLNKNLVFIAISGIQDPLRREVPGAIQICKKAGITVRMVTGDNVETATAIAKEAGILPLDYEREEGDFVVMEGNEFEQAVGGLVQENEDGVNEDGEEIQKTIFKVKNLDVMEKVSKKLKVLARSTPQHKYIMVTGLKQLDNVVAATGDGSNDAPALKQASIGFAMGIQGTEIAKQASGIILMDDNFSSIVTAVKWGRNVFDSVRKFLQFQLTVNAVALFMVFIGATVLRDSPLSVIQMLWVNLIMDTLAALALATEPPSQELLDRPPHGLRENIISPVMWRNVVCQALYQIAVLSIILFKGPQLFDVPSSIALEEWNEESGVHYTIFFQVFVMLQVFNEINSRKLNKTDFNVFKGFFNNQMFLFVMVVTFVIQFALVQFGGQMFRCTPLDINQHIICVLLGAGSLIVSFLSKLIPESYYDKFELFKQRMPIKEDIFRDTIVEKVRKPSKNKSSRSLKSFESLKNLQQQ